MHRMVIRAEKADIDDLGHVSNLVYLRWVLDVAMGHTHAVGWAHPEYRAVGAIFVVRRHTIDYVAPVFDGDEVELITWVGWWKGVSCERRTEMKRGGQVVARAATLWVFVDFESGKPRKIPDDVRAAFGPATGDVASSEA
jgi:acyl-CoA thioester hydrolase